MTNLTDEWTAIADTMRADIARLVGTLALVEERAEKAEAERDALRLPEPGTPEWKAMVERAWNTMLDAADGEWPGSSWPDFRASTEAALLAALTPAQGWQLPEKSRERM